jgi:hypothetical protein
MKNHYALNRGASTFLNEFGHEDVFVAKMPSISLTEWSAFESRDVIADKLRKGCSNSSSRVIFLMTQIVASVNTIRPTIKWMAEREYEGDRDYNDFTSTLSAPSDNSSYLNPLEQLAAMIENGGGHAPVAIPDIMTKFLVFHRTEPSSNVKILMCKFLVAFKFLFTINLILILVTRAKDPGVDDLLVQLIQMDGTDRFAWQLTENCETAEYLQHTSRLPHSSKNCENLDIYIFSAHPPLFGFTKNIGGYSFPISLLEK